MVDNTALPDMNGLELVQPGTEVVPPGSEGDAPPTEGVEPVATAQPSDQGIFGKMYERFMGTDINYDPQQIPRLITTITGSIAGGMAGSAAGGPIGALVGGVAGAAAGAIAPEGTMAALEATGILPSGYTNKNGLSPEDMRTVMEGESLLEAATGGGLTAARLGRRFITSKVVGISKAGRKIAENAAREDIAVLPVMVGDKKLPRQFISVFGRFPWLATPLRLQAQATEDQLQRAFRSLPGRAGNAAGAASMTDVSNEIFKDSLNILTDIETQFDRKMAQVYLKADQAGVKVIPTQTALVAKDVMAQIDAMRPAAIKGRMAMPPTKEMDRVYKYIQQNLANLSAKNAPAWAKGQTLTQMSTMLDVIDATGKDIAKTGDREALKMLERIRTAALDDLLHNARGADPQAAADITAEWLSIDREHSLTINSLFETATAKKFGTVRQRGLRGIFFSGDGSEATRVAEDKLADVILRGDSPQVIEELSRIVEPKTFKRLAATVMKNKLDAALSSVGEGMSGKVLDPEKFSDLMGITTKGSRYQQMSKMLAQAGGLTMKEVEDLLEVASAVGKIEVPNVSTFVARRGTIGGLRSVIRSTLPGVAVSAGAGATAGSVFGGSFTMGGILGGLMFVGGTRAISRMFSNPVSARFLRYAWEQEYKGAGRGVVREMKAPGLAAKRAMYNAARAALWATEDDGVSAEQIQQGQDILNTWFDEMDNKLLNAKDAIIRAVRGQ